MVYHLGQALDEHGRRQAATLCLRRALALDPAFAEAHYSLATLRDRLEGRVTPPAGFRRALAAAPGNGTLLCNIAAALHQRGQRWKAGVCWRHALAVDPALAQAHQTLGIINQEEGRLQAAIACFQHATAIDPEHAGAHVEEAMCHLLAGDYPRGWQQYRWRWRAGGGPASRRFTQPEWSGQDIAGRTILLHAEQGYGDTLQFCRYVPLVARHARVILEVKPPLRRLLNGMTGVTRVVGRGEALPPFDLHCPLMSLPAIFGTTVQTIPAQVPYLSVEPGRTALWRARLPEGQPQIGLCWAGHPAHRRDAERSLPLARLRPLLRRQKTGWHVLQKELRPTDRLALSAMPGRIEHRFSDFAETAALIAVLDLVITVDTAVAHLAGALGVPTWLMLPSVGDWRWLGGRDDSPWYPSLRLFRQPVPGDWDAVLARVAQTFGQWCANNHRVYDFNEKRVSV